MSETFISRIDGSVKNRENYPPTINEGGVLPEGLSNIFRAADETTYEKAVQLTIRTLGRDWNIDHNLLVMIAKHFHSVDESDYFIDILDSESWDIEVAWPTYCRNRGIEHEIECNPFN
jgi:hypothetical protein